MLSILIPIRILLLRFLVTHTYMHIHIHTPHITNMLVYMNAHAVAAELRRHWHCVFQGREVPPERLQAWLEHALPSVTRWVNAPPARWTVRLRDIKLALRISGNSSPGPDRIPFAVWRLTGDLGHRVLHAAAAALAAPGSADAVRAGGADHGDFFNQGLLRCLPKAQAGDDAVEGAFYEASSTRPLTIVNTDNRVSASAYRLRWEPILEPWISSQQQGFLRGRSLLSNVVSIEEAAMSMSLEESHPGLVLFDFASALLSRTCYTLTCMLLSQISVFRIWQWRSWAPFMRTIAATSNLVVTFTQALLRAPVFARVVHSLHLYSLLHWILSCNSSHESFPGQWCGHMQMISRSWFRIFHMRSLASTDCFQTSPVSQVCTSICLRSFASHSGQRRAWTTPPVDCGLHAPHGTL